MEYSDYVETRIPGSAPTGAELLAASQAGDAFKFTFSQIAGSGIATLTPDVSGSPIDLAMTHPEMIYILGNIGVNKTFTFTGSASKKINIKIPITADGIALTFPGSVVMSDSRFVSSVWSPLEQGTYYGTGFYDGTNWALTIPQIPSA